MEWIELWKAVILGIIEGITEWLPISSTGHMILVDEFIQLNTSEEFKEMFFVVIQLGAILAVVLTYWKKINPISIKRGLHIQWDIVSMWMKIIVACIPAGVIGLLWDDEINALFYNYRTVAIMLIVFGVLFIWVESRNQQRFARINSLEEITYRSALMIGLFQLVAAVFPGTSRSGATILGGIFIGMNRTVAAEFTFFLAIPVMFGASFIKLLKFGLIFSSMELAVLAVGMMVAFVVSIVVIKFLMQYIKKHDFKIFGWYRIILGIIVLAYFGF